MRKYWSVAELLRVRSELERAVVATHPEERESEMPHESASDTRTAEPLT
jgi:hypothetical protein